MKYEFHHTSSEKSHPPKDKGDRKNNKEVKPEQTLTNPYLNQELQGQIMNNYYSSTAVRDNELASYAIKTTNSRTFDIGGSSWKNCYGDTLTNKQLNTVKVYIFYIPDFESQTLKLIKDAIEKYGEDHVAISELETACDFSNEWGRIAGKPDLVVINSHGKNQSMIAGDDQLTSTGNGLTNISGSEVMNVQDLPQPQADLSQTGLYLNTCHSNDTEPKAHLEGDHRQGDLKGSKQTIANVFASQFNFNFVRATQDSVGYVWSLNSGWWWLIDDSWETGDPYPEDGTWEYLSKQKDGSILTVRVETP